MLSKIADGSAALVGICAVALVGDHLLNDRPIVPPNEDVAVANWPQVEVGRRRGATDPVVVIVEWGDYECPVCQWFHGQVEAVLRRHPEQVAFVYRHWPLTRHRLAYPAAAAAECAGDQGVFWEFHERLYETESWVGMGFMPLAKASGISDSEEFSRCLNEDRPRERIEDDIAAAKKIGGRGTPTVVINGTFLGSPPDSLAMFQFVATALADGES